MPLTTDISLYIQENIGTWITPDNGANPNGNIYESFLPDTPDRACCVYQLPGGKVQRALGRNFSWENPRLRIVNRVPIGTAGEPDTGGFPLAASDAQAIWNLLNPVANQTINGVYYIVLDSMGLPTPQTLDVNNRPLYTQEYTVMRQVAD